jgi:N6-L-threonylcarbamoyladenine synthase
MCLVVSGGHTHLALAKSYTEFEVIGRTRDDAIGEAYDKVARTLGLPYPGGPYVDELAKTGNREAIHFKRTFLEKESYDFSFSGIKSGVLNYLNQSKLKKIEIVPADVAASFQEAVIEVLVTKAMDALAHYKMDTLVVAGGVAANSRLREALSEEIAKTECRVYYPSLVLCTDNAAMIGASAFYHSREHKSVNLELNATPNLRLGE